MVTRLDCLRAGIYANGQAACSLVSGHGGACRVPASYKRTPALPPKPLPGVGQTVPDPRRRSHFAQINGVQYPYPTCARCKRDVVVFTWGDHFEHDQTRPMRTFFVACHGEIDSVTFAQDELHGIKMNDFKFVEAFGAKELPVGEEVHYMDTVPEDAKLIGAPVPVDGPPRLKP